MTAKKGARTELTDPEEEQILSWRALFLTSKARKRKTRAGGGYVQTNFPPPFADDLPRKPLFCDLCLPHGPIDSFPIIQLPPIGLERSQPTPGLFRLFRLLIRCV